MSVAEGTPAILLPADPGFRAQRERDARRGRVRRAAIIAAALAHVAVIIAVMVHWPALFPAVPQERPPIPVTLVTEPPPAPQPKVPPAQLPSPPHDLVSGPDAKTTAPKTADLGPEAAPQSTALPTPEVPSKTATPEAKPSPAPEAHPVKPKLATRETTQKPTRGVVNRAPGEQVQEGDPYLNHLNELLNAHYHYPANAISPLGLHLEGTVAVLVGIMEDGSLRGVDLLRSSGSTVLDQEAIKEIEEAAPFPPPPAYLMRGGLTVLERDVHYFPGAS